MCLQKSFKNLANLKIKIKFLAHQHADLVKLHQTQFSSVLQMGKKIDTKLPNVLSQYVPESGFKLTSVFQAQNHLQWQNPLQGMLES
jgi:sulfate adenylyltransferase subunit 1 (EFTu-like GTPase family)